MFHLPFHLLFIYSSQKLWLSVLCKSPSHDFFKAGNTSLTLNNPSVSWKSSGKSILLKVLERCKNEGQRTSGMITWVFEHVKSFLNPVSNCQGCLCFSKKVHSPLTKHTLSTSRRELKKRRMSAYLVFSKGPKPKKCYISEPRKQRMTRKWNTTITILILTVDYSYWLTDPLIVSAGGWWTAETRSRPGEMKRCRQREEGVMGGWMDGWESGDRSGCFSLALLSCCNLFCLINSFYPSGWSDSSGCAARPTTQTPLHPALSLTFPLNLSSSLPLLAHLLGWSPLYMPCSSVEICRAGMM